MERDGDAALGRLQACRLAGSGWGEPALSGNMGAAGGNRATGGKGRKQQRGNRQSGDGGRNFGAFPCPGEGPHLTLPVPPSARPSLLLSEMMRENLARETAGEEAYWQPVDTMKILAAGQEIELTVLDNSRYVKEATVYQEPPYDVAVFVTLASEALDHLNRISNFRSAQWSVLWSVPYSSPFLRERFLFLTHSVSRYSIWPLRERKSSSAQAASSW